MKQVQSHITRYDSGGQAYGVPVTMFENSAGHPIAEISDKELLFYRRVWNAKNIEILAEIVAAFQKEVSE